MAVDTENYTKMAPTGNTSGSVVSKDGTTIAYRQVGSGPGLVLLHGVMETAESHIQLADALAGDFTLFLPDRRGRGGSGPFGGDHSIQKEVEDLDAVLAATGARYVFGVSAGGLICLQAALTLPAIRKIAVYEPPLSINGSAPTSWLERFDREMAEGKVAAALITSMKGSQMGPAIFNHIPNALLTFLMRLMMKQEAKKGVGINTSMEALAPTLHYDSRMIIEMSDTLERFRAVPVGVLLLGGNKSAAYLRDPLFALERVLPRARRVELAGLGHGGSGNKDRGGQPERVAQELQRFFDARLES